jgi:hypothetical protein
VGLVIGASFRWVLGLGALAALGLALDVALAVCFTTDGQRGEVISRTDLTTGLPLVGLGMYVVFVFVVWAVWRNPGIQRRRVVRHAARERLAVQIGPRHPVRQFRVLHPYWAHILQVLLIFKGLELVFGPVGRRRG